MAVKRNIVHKTKKRKKFQKSDLGAVWNFEILIDGEWRKLREVKMGELVVPKVYEGWEYAP